MNMNICVPSNKYSRCACTVLISVVSACELFIEKTAENMRSIYRCLRGLLHQKIPKEKHAYKIQPQFASLSSIFKEDCSRLLVANISLGLQ